MFPFVILSKCSKFSIFLPLSTSQIVLTYLDLLHFLYFFIYLILLTILFQQAIINDIYTILISTLCLCSRLSISFSNRVFVVGFLVTCFLTDLAVFGLSLISIGASSIAFYNSSALIKPS